MNGPAFYRARTLVCGILLLCSCPAAVHSQNFSLRGLEGSVPGEVIVRLRNTTDPKVRDRVLSEAGSSRPIGGSGLFHVRLRAGLAVEEALRSLRGQASVSWAQPNYRYHALACGPPTDLYYASPADWPFQKVQAEAAWALFTSCASPPGPGSSSVTVAVIDTGVSRNHPDLSDPALFTVGYNAFTGTADSAGATVSDDDFGHGTFVTGIIAAGWGSNVAESCPPHALTSGMAGLAPGIRIMPVKILDHNGNGTTDTIVSGTDWAVAHGARVLNFSLGSPNTEGLDLAEQGSLDNALANDCVVVASAGNESAALDYPAAYPPVLSVGATDPDDQVACYSNYGADLKLVAPGGKGHGCQPCPSTCYDPANDIFSALLQCPTAASPEFPRAPDPNFCTAAGTSASAPFVTATAALVRSLYPDLTAPQVVRRIVDNADSLNGGKGWDPKTGYGRLNVYRALSGSSPDVTPYLKTFNSPNPFHPDVEGTTNITLAIDRAGTVDLAIYDRGGEMVLRRQFAAAQLNENPSNPQFKSFFVPWDGRNGSGQMVATGVYFYSVTVGGLTGRNKIALIRGAK